MALGSRGAGCWGLRGSWGSWKLSLPAQGEDTLYSLRGRTPTYQKIRVNPTLPTQSDDPPHSHTEKTPPLLHRGRTPILPTQRSDTHILRGKTPHTEAGLSTFPTSLPFTLPPSSPSLPCTQSPTAHSEFTPKGHLWPGHRTAMREHCTTGP